ncbi:MAG TPA: PAS domain-containing protein, partial [Burkholderiaceae bacterium]|nr:PAS domain-containing protein [Burkholderiaceae bacterium]
MAPDRSAPLPPTLDAGVRAFLDGSPAATIAIRLDGRVAYANPAYATLIGEPDPAALADRSIGFGTWHDGAAALAACRATQAQGAWQGPLTARHRDGTPVPVSCAARMLADADGREDTLLITLLPRTDAAPQPPSPGDDASLMQAVVGAAGVLIVVVAAAGRIVRVNGECERVSGWRGDELAGRPIRESIVSESSARDAREAFSRMLSPDGPGRIDG